MWHLKVLLAYQITLLRITYGVPCEPKTLRKLIWNLYDERKAMTLVSTIMNSTRIEKNEKIFLVLDTLLSLPPIFFKWVLYAMVKTQFIQWLNEKQIIDIFSHVIEMRSSMGRGISPVIKLEANPFHHKDKAYIEALVRVVHSGIKEPTPIHGVISDLIFEAADTIKYKPSLIATILSDGGHILFPMNDPRTQKLLSFVVQHGDAADVLMLSTCRTDLKNLTALQRYYQMRKPIKIKTKKNRFW